MDIPKMFICGTLMTFSVFIMRAFLKEKLPRRIFVFLWYATCALLIVSGIALLDWIIERVPAARRAIDRMIERLERE